MRRVLVTGVSQFLFYMNQSVIFRIRTLNWWCCGNYLEPSSATGGRTTQNRAWYHWKAARYCRPHSPPHDRTAHTWTDMEEGRWRWSELAPAGTKATKYKNNLRLFMTEVRNWEFSSPPPPPLGSHLWIFVMAPCKNIHWFCALN